MALRGKSVRDIHKQLLKDTLNQRKVYAFMVKVANRAVKTVSPKMDMNANGVLLLFLFNRLHVNSKAKKIINKECVDEAENGKQKVIKDYIDKSRDTNKWFYLASSHNDCAADHLDWQGKIYYDDKAPEDIVKYAKKHGYDTLQWVMGAPVYFITRPNCRHFFKSFPIDIIKRYSRKELTRRYKMHRMDGDKSLATPQKIAVEEYEDRLKMLEAMYREHPTEHLRREIDKTRLLIKKWKKLL